MAPFLTRQRPRAPSSADERFDVLHKAAEVECDFRSQYPECAGPIARRFLAGCDFVRPAKSTLDFTDAKRLQNTSPAGRGRRALARRVRVTRPDVSLRRFFTLRTSRSCEAKLAAMSPSSGLTATFSRREKARDAARGGRIGSRVRLTRSVVLGSGRGARLSRRGRSRRRRRPARTSLPTRRWPRRRFPFATRSNG